MKKQKRRRYRILGILSLSIVIAAATYGFAAANSETHSPGILGADYGVISSFQVSKIVYTLDLEDPTRFIAVEFALEGGAGNILAGVSEFKDSQVTWAENCQLENEKWNCKFGNSIDVLAADWLHVTFVE